MGVKFFSIIGGGACFLSLNSAYAEAIAASPVYDVPSVSATAAPPFLYQQSPQLGNQVVISNIQIVRSGANNIGQLINNVAGIQYIPGLSAEPQVLIHSEPALILVNGQPLANFSMSNPDINLIPLSEIEKIVITPGVAGTIYGNQSLGGVVNIITKPTTVATNSLSLSAGSPWTDQIVAVSAGPMTQNLSYRANAQAESDQGYRDNSQSNLGRGGIDLQQTYATGSVGVDVDLLRQTQEFAGYLTDIQAQQNPTQSIAAQGQGTYQANTGLINLNWTQEMNNLWAANTNVSYRIQNANSNLDGYFGQNYNTLTLNPDFSGQFQALNRAVQTDVGFNFSNENYSFESPTFYSNIDGANQQQYSTYASLDFPFTSKLSLAASGRVVAIETQGQFFNNTTYQFNPESSQSQNISLFSLGLNDQLNTETAVYIRRAMGYQLPFIDESNFTANLTNGFGLQATTSTAYETGINWQGTQLQWDAEAFLINLENEIGFYVPPNGIAANYNLSPTQREGVTADATYALTPKWTVGTSLTWMNNRFREGLDSGNEIPGASNALADFNARYQINSIWSIYAESQYVGQEYAEGDNANVSTEIPGYWLENLAVNAQFSAWLVSFRIDNITNTQYNLATVYDPYLSGAYNNPVAYYPAPGRTGMVSLTYQF